MIRGCRRKNLEFAKFQMNQPHPFFPVPRYPLLGIIDAIMLEVLWRGYIDWKNLSLELIGRKGFVFFV